jgi:nucleoside-diphosphate-sugar epimerase
MKVLLTGANGFIGRHVAAELASHAVACRAMIQPGTSAESLAGVCAEIEAADLLDPAALDRAAAGCSAVVHLAALVQEWGRWRWFERVNVAGTRNLAEAAIRAGASRFVFISSLAVHGRGDFIDGDEEAPLDPCGNPYARSKIRCEEYLRTLQRDGKLEAVLVRPGLVPYGEWDVRGFVPLARALAGGRMPVTGNPGNLTCTVYAGNLASGIRLCLERPEAAGRTYVLTDDLQMSWEGYFRAIGAELGFSPRLVRLPGLPIGLAAGLAEMLWLPAGPGGRPPITRYLARLMTRHTHFSCDRARRELGYTPRLTFQEAMRRTCQWAMAE